MDRFHPTGLEGRGRCPPGDTSVTAGVSLLPAVYFPSLVQEPGRCPAHPGHVCWQQARPSESCPCREPAAGSAPGRDGRRQRDRSCRRSGSEACRSALQHKQDPYTNWCEPKPLFPRGHTRTQLTAACPCPNLLRNSQSWMPLKVSLVMEHPFATTTCRCQPGTATVG